MYTVFAANSIRAKRFERAVEISARMFLRDGIEAVKMTDIADECCIGVATLYRYFGTKTGITIAAMTYLWNDVKQMFSGVFGSENFRRQLGIKQLAELMKLYIVLYETHPGFLKLLGEFDLLIQRENIPKENLREYDQSIINFYPVFESAYMIGIADGSVREDVDIKLFYVSFGHALMSLGKKLVQRELLPSDDFSIAKAEMELIIESGVSYLRKREQD